MIIIGKDVIYAGILTWIVSLNGKDQFFVNKEEAIEFYCGGHCNPMYNEAHYDCECCPIKNEEVKT